MQEIIETRSGKLTGVRANGYTKYLGIPYAMPPIGERAFRRPEPMAWEGVLTADTLRKNPIQAAYGYTPAEFDEDCLYLNIWVPEGARSDTPVMVYFYGGSYAYGGTGVGTITAPQQALCVNAPRYDMEKFCLETGCIMVTFNYRVNLYGFLDLRFADPSFEPNLGLRDQIMAVRWIHDNIAAFGGDAENITLFGQSAGAACIMALMSIPEAQPLFAKAIVQSACIDHFYTPQESKAIAQQYLKFAGVNPNDLKAIRNLPVETVMEANNKLESYTANRFDTRCAFSPVIDGELLKDYPKNLAPMSGKPMLIGTTAMESTIFIQSLPAPLLKMLSWKAGLNDRAYPGKLRERCGRAMTELMYKAPMRQLLEHTDTRHAWVYEFEFTTPYLEQSGLHSCHTVELALLFDYYKQVGWYQGAWDQAEQAGQKLRCYWGNFAKTGNPNSPGQADWQPYATDRTIYAL